MSRSTLTRLFAYGRLYDTVIGGRLQEPAVRSWHASAGMATKLPCWDNHLVIRRRSADKRSAFGLMRTLTAVLQSGRAKICIDAMPYSSQSNEGTSLSRAVDALRRAYGKLALF